jgi:hypothetical protein
MLEGVSPQGIGAIQEIIIDVVGRAHETVVLAHKGKAYELIT